MLRARKTISFTEFGELVARLYDKIKASRYKPDLIISILDNGFFIGCSLANWFGCFNFPIRISFYYKDNELQSVPIVSLNGLNRLKFADYKRVLLVDDIIDSGKTMKLIFNRKFKFKKLKVACLHWNPYNMCGIKPNFYAEKKYNSEWIVYPWEERK